MSLTVAEMARPGRVRERVLSIYARAARDWTGAPGELSRGLRECRDLHSRQRRFVGDAVYGLVRWRRRLAFIALGTDDGPPLALYLALLVAEHGVPPAEIAAELAELGLDGARLAEPDRLIDAIVDPGVRLGVEHSQPDWLVQRLVGELGVDETNELLAAMNSRAPLTARANRLKTTPEALVERLRADGVDARPSSLAPDALLLDTHQNAYGLTAFRDGLFEIQDAGSQLICELVAPPRRGTIIDACAGAGGKTLALAARLHNQGRIVALDISNRKLTELRERARRAGVTNTRALTVTPDGALPDVAQPSDRVLVDAPCSGIGVLRRNPEARWRLQPRDLDELPSVQRQILDRYAPLVRPGGRLIYATCTVLRAENDAIVDEFLAAHDGFVEMPAKEILGAERAAQMGDGTRLRLWPHRHDTDGFFAAVLRRVR
jgi:16S rRNA (cytosine967-C5)-methyltransferase